MAYGFQLRNASDETIVSGEYTNFFVHSRHELFWQVNDYQTGMVTNFPMEHANEVVLARPNPATTGPYSGLSQHPILLNRWVYTSWGVGDDYSLSQFRTPSMDTLICKTFYDENVGTESGYGLNVYADNGAYIYSSTYKDSNVSCIANVKINSTGFFTTRSGLDLELTLADQDLEYITFQFDSLDDIYVGLNATWWLPTQYTLNDFMGVCYIYDFDANQIHCMRGHYGYLEYYNNDLGDGELEDWSGNPLPYSNINANSYRGNVLNEYEGQFSIFKVTGLD